MTNYDFGLAAPGYILRLIVTEDTLNAVANTSRVVGNLVIIKGTGSGKNTGYTVNWSINLNGNTASGSLPGYDFTGYSILNLWSGAYTITHNADGSKSISVAGAFSETDPAPELGNGSVGGTFALTTLRQAPNAPTGVTGTYVSDTSVALAWTNNYPSNGAPTTNNIQASVNGGAFASLMSIAATTSVNGSTAANRKTIYQVNAQNSTGTSAWSASSAPVYTTPATPTGLTATKTGSDIALAWVNNVGFAEYLTEVWHGTITAGVTTWDGSALTTRSTGVTTYTHTAPNPAQVHVYRVRAKNLDTGALTSSYVVSNSVQLLAPPNAPTLGTVPAKANKAANLVIGWTHNPVDTTAQKYYEFGYSTNGGASWSSTGKVTSGTSSYTIPASTYVANDAVTVRVRTWGDAATGGADGAGASAWSSTKTVTFKTLPVATITSPANASTYTQATLTVVLGFSQAESATFVQATIGLYQGATLLEQIDSTTLGGTTFATRVADAVSYTVKATVKDSNGLVSAQVSSTFSVSYTKPVLAAVVATYYPTTGVGQLALTFPTAGVGEVDAVAVTITRTINGVSELVADRYPVAGPTLTLIDTTPTINGSNLYTVTTISVDGATTVAVVSMDTTEPYWAFLNTGIGYSTVVAFQGDLQVSATPARSQALIPTSGRNRPIALFGRSGTLDVSGSATLTDDLGATPQDMEAFILAAGLVCYRDPSGRRMFGALNGSVASPSSLMSTFQFHVSEAT